jgi:TnpA family transposase
MSESTTSKRLTILTADEIDALYDRPIFTYEERLEYFELTPPEQVFLSQLSTPIIQIYFILQLGYFKARHRFFRFTLEEVKADLHYIQTRYFVDLLIEPTLVPSTTHERQQDIILNLTGYRRCGDAERDQLRHKARQLARIDSQPIYILRELFAYLTHHSWIAPGYSWFQDMIGEVLVNEQERLIAIIIQQLTDEERDALKILLTNQNGLYEITQLKHEPRSFANRELAREIQRGQQMKPLYKIARRLLPQLNISNESIKYYASLIHYYTVYQMSQRDFSLISVYLLCFIYDRYQMVQDHLIITFLHHVQNYQTECRLAAQQMVYEQTITYTKNLKKAGQVLYLLINTDDMPDDNSISQLREKAYRIINRTELDTVAHQLTQQSAMDEVAFWWQHLDTLERSFKLSLRPIIRVITLEGTTSVSPLLAAIQFLQQIFIKKHALTQYDEGELPLDIIPAHLKRYLYGRDEQNKKQLLVDRYEFLIYRLTRDEIEAGTLFARHSVQYRRLEEELLSDQQWKDKVDLIKQTDLPLLQVNIEEHLKHLQTQLETLLKVVNERILSGDNPSIQRKSTRSKRQWHLPQPTLETEINHPFFNTLPQLDIDDVIHFVQQRCQFLDEFQHLIHRNRRTTFEDTILVATLVAWATNTGIGRMSGISDISHTQMAAASDNFLRPQTLKPANDRVINYIAGLPIFQHHMINNQLHSSSDGQKFETAIPTFNARYSPKYFGLKKGIVAYTLVANHVPINARIIGAHEHESHFVFDILFNNTTAVQPQIHSTDVHGVNRLNFALLHLFGYQFAPRYKDFYEQMQTGLHGFKSPADYDDTWLIKPIRKLRPDYIISEWDNVQRLMVSLALKNTTQHLVISKLHGYTRQHKTRRALEEYDHIIHSLYLLNYLDSLSLRHNVQRALNRGESYHQLRRAVAYANFGKLRFRTPYEQNLWQECSRLITNCIIAYNATILSDLLMYHQSMGNDKQVQLLRRVSPVAWQHINLHGRYEFNKPPQMIDVTSLVQLLAQHDIELLEKDSS